MDGRGFEPGAVELGNAGARRPLDLPPRGLELDLSLRPPGEPSTPSPEILNLAWERYRATPTATGELSPAVWEALRACAEWATAQQEYRTLQGQGQGGANENALREAFLRVHDLAQQEARLRDAACQAEISRVHEACQEASFVHDWEVVAHFKSNAWPAEHEKSANTR